MNNDLLFLINTTASLEKIITSNHKNGIETSNIFLLNSILRINKILNSVYILNEDKHRNNYSIFILLRPIILDLLFFNYIRNYLFYKKDYYEQKELLEKISENCILDGVKKYHKSIIEKCSETEIKEIEVNFKKFFFFSIKDINVPFKNYQFHESIKDYDINASYMFNKIHNINSQNKKMFDDLYFAYQHLSKFDHNTIISFYDNAFQIENKNYSSIELCINLIFNGIYHLFGLIMLENNLPELIELYNEYIEQSKL